MRSIAAHRFLASNRDAISAVVDFLSPLSHCWDYGNDEELIEVDKSKTRLCLPVAHAQTASIA